MSRRLARATSDFLARRSRRRSFLTKTAMAGSALAVAPKQFILEPRTAYAAMCNCVGTSCPSCSSLCCDGYTEFCCTIYGTNGCPPGSLYGGWWKVSGSSYCGGNNRYYMDCHSQCGSCGCGSNGVCSGSCSGTPCGCALGSCNNRKAGCTQFRYGQCNRQIRCVGPIICRVVTCTAPWQLEPTCTTSTRTDEATRWHNRACLQSTGRAPLGGVDAVETSPGRVRVVGWALDPDVLDSITVNITINGTLTASVVADETRFDIGAAYPTYGADHGFDITLNTTSGSKEVCVYGVNSEGGANPLLGCRTVTVSGSSSAGELEGVVVEEGVATLSGWAAKPESDTPLEVEILVDGEPAERVIADRPRGDLANTFANGGTDHGFEATVDVGAGEYEFCVQAFDPDADEPVPIGCQTVQGTAAPTPVGALEQVDVSPDGAVEVSGWILPGDGQAATELALLVGGTEVGRVETDQARPDVAAAYGDAGSDAGFIAVIDPGPGDHDVCVYVVVDDEPGQTLGCASISVA